MKRAILAAFAVACAGTQDARYLVVHHRANGCDSSAPENSLAGARCVAAACAAGAAPCALEVDVRAVRMGEGLELLLMHDATSRRTADCPVGEINFPGEGTTDRSALAACRLLRPDGTPSDEPVPTLDELVAALAGAPVALFLELKTVGEAALDHALVDASLAKLGRLRSSTVLTSFDTGALAYVRSVAPDVFTACFAPSGAGAAQVVTALTGGTLADVERCLQAGHDFVFVPPSALDGQVAARVRHSGVRLGVFGADTADGHDMVRAWRDVVDVVYADHPSMYSDRHPRPSADLR